MGGNKGGDGGARFSDKVIKIPSKKGPEALRSILQDFNVSRKQKETFSQYYDRMGKRHFYELLKPLSEVKDLDPKLAIDWGHSETYIRAIGIGECAGVVIDLVATLLFESEEKLENAKLAIDEGRWADSIYHSYSALLNTAKAVLVGENIKTNTQAGITEQFDRYFVDSGLLDLKRRFSEIIYQIRENEPGENFARAYLGDTSDFYSLISSLRKKLVSNEQES